LLEIKKAKEKIVQLIKRVGTVFLFILYVGYIFYKAPLFNEFRVINLIEYALVLLVGGYTVLNLLRNQIYPLFRK